MSRFEVQIIQGTKTPLTFSAVKSQRCEPEKKLQPPTHWADASDSE